MRKGFVPGAALVRGVSVFETLTALALVALLLTLSSGSMLALLGADGHATGTRALTETLATARTEAALRGVPVGVCGLVLREPHDTDTGAPCAPAATPWRDGWLIFVDDNLNGWRDEGEAILRIVRPGGGVSIRSPHPAVVFRPGATLAHATALTLAVESDGRSRLVCIGIDGFMRLASPSVGCRG
ncbi:MAG: GspH/FimT family protein [Burkholderiaceae bacterium]|nr:GspH/FimT family protein [Burkholderiaceae bacterium]